MTGESPTHKNEKSPWSTRQVALRSGVPETTARRLIDELEQFGTPLTNWDLDRATIGLRAYRGDHPPQAIKLIGEAVDIDPSAWLLSSHEGECRIFPTLLQATSYLEVHTNDDTFALSPVGKWATSA